MGRTVLRPLCLLILTLSFAARLQADPLDALLAAAHDGNRATVESLIREAPDRTAQRDLVWALAATDPDTVAFAKDWAAAETGNPVALSARAWSLYWAASQVRGERIRRHTYPPLLEEAQRMYRQALDLAQRAAKLDPRFLPASDAVIRIAVSAGRQEVALAELERIMALDPNRHSLVLTASALTPAWGGSFDLMQGLCGQYAGLVADVPGYDFDTCLAQAILRGNMSGDLRDVAISVIAPKSDAPFLEREILKLARDHALPFEAVERLSARLADEGRMSVFVLLSWTQDLLQFGELPDKAGFEAALKLDLAMARKTADRDPGFLTPLRDLIDLFQIEYDFLSFQVLNKANPSEAATQREALLLRQAEELDQRARRLLALTPRDSDVLQFAVDHIRTPDPDPLEADRWAINLLNNAAIYASYQERQTGKIVVQAKERYARMRERMASGEVPAYSDAQLDEVYLCPYFRAVRIVDAICSDHEWGEEACLLESVLQAPSDSSLDSTLYSEIVKRGACKSDRDAPLEDLLYQRIDVKPLP